MIPHGHLLPQDMVDVLDHGPKDNRHPHPVPHRMHAVDAKHAVAADPERWTWKGEKPTEPEPESKPIEDRADSDPVFDLDDEE